MSNYTEELTVPKPRELVCDVLRELGKITKIDIDRALEVQRQSGQKTGRILIDLGIIPEEDLRLALSKIFNMPVWEKQEGATYPVVDFLPINFMLTNKVLPIRFDDDSIDYAIVDPQDQCLLECLQSSSDRAANMFVGCEKEIVFALEEIYEPEKSDDESDVMAGGSIGVDDDIEHLRDIASEAPVIRLVSSILSSAVELGASDVHMELFEKKTSLRYRIDGVLREFPPPPADLYTAVVSRIKIMSKLNIAEKRLPQDGRIILKVAGKEIDLRVSIIPMNFGEGVVLRILDRASISLDLEILGFSEDLLKTFRELVNKPNGIILVTGPTGSGKTTSLYAVLKEKVSPGVKIITIEDPVEYSLEGVNQIQINPQIKLTFASGLRSILRHDPDVILIGEIRDQETAAIAIQSALTGHLVFSTLHTNNAASAFTRLMDMGIEDYLVSSSVIGVLAQRLMRRLCNKCREEYVPEPDVLDKLYGQMALISDKPHEDRTRANLRNKGLQEVKPQPLVQGQGESGAVSKLYRAKGCNECGLTGYSGRMCIAELLLVDNSIRELINSRSDSNVIARAAIKMGSKTLWQDGLGKVMKGISTIDELIRITDADEEDDDEKRD
ncbi:MAG: GspE/PulE family protein [Candidatus Anammoxibacter sp.]